MKQAFIILLCALSITVNAQTDSIESSTLTFSGYLEAYYSYDFGNPDNHTRPGFIYSFNRHNEANINIGFIKAAYTQNKVRANLALMSGTYTNANLAAEPGVLKNIFEANAGVKISKKHNLWLDAGIFPAHIGFESAVGKDCWTVTRSMLADNSPYFESGAKLTYTTENGKWLVSGLLLNGWQRIQRVDGNNTPAFGHQLTFKPSARVTLNSSSFVGSDTPDETRLMRYFHNFYGQFQVNDQLGLILGFDIGAQQQTKGSNDFNTWYTPVAIIKYAASPKLSLAVRGEYYADKNQVIIATGTANGFQTYGYSANIDYAITNNAVWRVEFRGLQSKDRIFILDNQPDAKNYSITTSLAVAF